MEIWVPGALALVGALAGVLLTSLLTRITKRAEDRRKRIEDALRCVVLAISARNFATRARAIGKPEFVEASDLREVERRMYLENVERMFVTLREARQAVAVLIADGVDLGNSWRGDEEMQAELDSVYLQLLAALAGNAWKRRRQI